MSFDVEISVEGVRVQPWLYQPDGEVLERLEWLTDPKVSFDGSEQRIQLRELPRRSFEWRSTLTDRDRREAENLLFYWHAHAFAIPVWMDGENLAAQLDAGSSSIPAATATRDYHVDGLVCVMTDARTFEILQVASVAADHVVTANPTAGTWPAGASVFPMRAARLPDTTKLSRFTGGASYGRFQWACIDDSENDAATETAYRSYPVLLTKPNWTEDLQQDYVRKLQQLDPRVGARFWDEGSDGAILLQTHRWLLDGRAEIGAFREWLYARKGRLSAFWLPTWAQDLVVAADIGAVALTIDVEHSGYTDFIAEDIGRRDIRIQVANGTVYYRRITNCVEVNANVERLTIDSALGTLTDSDDVVLVSFMALVRLDADAVELNWWKWDAVESSLTTRGMRNDV